MKCPFVKSVELGDARCSKHVKPLSCDMASSVNLWALAYVAFLVALPRIPGVWGAEVESPKRTVGDPGKPIL